MNYIVIIALVLLVGYFVARSRSGQGASATDFQSIDVSQAKELMKSRKPTIIDVRTPMEVSAGKIDKALTINVANPSFKKEIKKLDKDGMYIIYCRSGRRSASACNIMSKEGFTNLYNLSGGYNAWK